MGACPSPDSRSKLGKGNQCTAAAPQVWSLLRSFNGSKAWLFDVKQHFCDHTEIMACYLLPPTTFDSFLSCLHWGSRTEQPGDSLSGYISKICQRGEKKKRGKKTPLVRYFGFKSPILKCNCILNSSWWFDNSFIGIGPFQAERGIVWIMKKNIFGFIRGSVSFPTLNV